MSARFDHEVIYVCLSADLGSDGDTLGRSDIEADAKAQVMSCALAQQADPRSRQVEMNDAARNQHNREKQDRNPVEAAAYGGDSHRMHHFLDVDAKGQPDRSILSQPHARELAEQHRPMFEKYRGDIENLRAGVSVGAAITRGAQGIADEIGRHMPDTRESPFKDAGGSEPQRADSPEHRSDPRTPRHPDNPMYLQIRDGVGALHGREGKPFDETAERTTASLLVASKANGLDRVDHVLSGRTTQGDQNVFAVQGDLHDPAHRRAQVSVAEAAQTPVVESFRKLETAEARLAQAPVQEQAQDQNRSVTTRSV